MKYDYAVIFKGKFYKAGEEIPTKEVVDARKSETEINTVPIPNDAEITDPAQKPTETAVEVNKPANSTDKKSNRRKKAVTDNDNK